MNGIFLLLFTLHNRPSPSETLFLRESQNLRTIIVIADIDQGLHSASTQHFGFEYIPITMQASLALVETNSDRTRVHSVRKQSAGYRPWLTFWHWSGVTSYTSTFVFAGSCVFGKQLAGVLSLRPHLAMRQALSRSYGRFFAEFLGEYSLVRLGLLDLSTCVGFWYGRTQCEA